jgi:hypothetical protein
MYTRKSHQLPIHHAPNKHRPFKKPNVHKLFAEDLQLLDPNRSYVRQAKADSSSLNSEPEDVQISSRPVMYATPTREHRLRHNPGSVYHHAIRLSPYLSSSTNFSSSLSGSIEVIVSELEHQEEAPRDINNRLSPLGERSEHNSQSNSDASETEKIIREIIKERDRSFLETGSYDYHSEPEPQRQSEKSFYELAAGMQEILTEHKAQAIQQERERCKLKKQLLKMFNTFDGSPDPNSQTFSQDSITSEESLPELKEPIHIAESISKKPLGILCPTNSPRKAVIQKALSSLLSSDPNLLHELLQVLNRINPDHLFILLTRSHGALSFSGLYNLSFSGRSLSRVWAIASFAKVIELSNISGCYKYDITYNEFIEVELEEIHNRAVGICILPYS